MTVGLEKDSEFHEVNDIDFKDHLSCYVKSLINGCLAKTDHLPIVKEKFYMNKDSFKVFKRWSEKK